MTGRQGKRWAAALAAMVMTAAWGGRYGMRRGIGRHGKEDRDSPGRV